MRRGARGQPRLALVFGRPVHPRQGKARTGKEVALSALSPTVSDGHEFVESLDALGDDQPAELEAQANGGSDELLLARLAIDALDEISIELYYARLQVG